MIKKEYMTPVVEEFELELQCPILELSTPEEGYDNEDIEDI